MLLWLWHRLAATAPITPLTWETPYAVGSGPRKGKKDKKDTQKKIQVIFMAQFHLFFKAPQTSPMFRQVCEPLKICACVFFLSLTQSPSLLSLFLPLSPKLPSSYSSYRFFFFFFGLFVFLPFLGLLPQHMEVPRLGVQSEL